MVQDHIDLVESLDKNYHYRDICFKDYDMDCYQVNYFYFGWTLDYDHKTFI